MKTSITIIFIITCFSQITFAKNDSTSAIYLNSKIEILENSVKEIRRDQLNYSIEKKILKEAYTLNYDRINITITFILGLFGLLGFLGIRNINSIKKEYTTELNELKIIRNEFESKISSFDLIKQKFEGELKELNRTNKSQNVKIQILELKEKIEKLIKDDNLLMALETVSAALSLAPNDVSLLRNKSIINSRLGNYPNSIKLLKQALGIEPQNDLIITDLVEQYYFNNQEDEAEKTIKDNSNLKDFKDEKLIQYFSVIASYHNDKVSDFINLVVKQVDDSKLETKIKHFHWDFNDIHYFHAHVKYPGKEDILLNYVMFLKGKISGKILLDRISDEGEE